MFSAACAIALLCLVPLSHSAPLACEDSVRPLDQLNLHNLVGRWALVAGSLNSTSGLEILKRRDSIAIDLHNSSYTQVNSVGGQCQYLHHDFSLEGHILTMKVGAYNFTVNFFHTACPDCMVFTLDIKAPRYESVDFYLFSKRRELDQKEMEDFRAQVECLMMPPPVVMDPTKEFCPEQTASKPAAPTEEKPADQKA